MVAAVAGLWVFMRARRMSVRRAVAVIRLRLCECSSACRLPRLCTHICCVAYRHSSARVHAHA